MKKIERIKTLQLIVFFLIALACIYIIIVKSDTYYQIAESKDLQILTALLWVILFAAFLFIFLDFTLYARQKSDYNALDYAVHSDPLAKIANRQGCDEIIEKYIDQPLPDHMGVVMFLLTSLNDINRFHNRLLGNKQIRNFSIILKLAAANICFVGRNGGNVFMAIFEEAADENLDVFLSRIEEKVIEYNLNKEELPMYYTLGTSLKSEESEDVTINALISTANKKAHGSGIYPAGTVTISDMQQADEAESATSVHEAEVITKESVAISDPVLESTTAAKASNVRVEAFSVPSFAIAAKILDVAKAVIAPTSAPEDYKYTEDEKFGPRDEDESYIIVSFREAV